jgi:stage II sporulation protein R
MLRFISTVLISVATFFTLNAIIPSASETQIYDACVRLHVIANSNDDGDQELKLKVRDALLDKISSYELNGREEALAKIENEKETLEKIASEVISKEGYDYGVQLEIGEESYPTRNYEDFSLPAGKYTSVRVKIGEAEGENWWCVLYPPLCNAGAVAYENGAYTDVGLTKDQYSLITGNTGEYKVKFKLIEVAAQLAGFEY